MSAVVAAIPIIVLFIMLGALRKPAWVSAVTALVSALIVALVAFGMPAHPALTATPYGAAYGMFPIAWVVFASIILYRIFLGNRKFGIIKDFVRGLYPRRPFPGGVI